MKTAFLFAIIIMVSIGAVASFYFYNAYFAPQNPSSSSPTCNDPGSINSHVYHPNRLEVLMSCTTASGTVDRTIEEQDGDLHVRLALDHLYSNLTNSANDDYQYGDLVVEIICVNTPSQGDAISSCQGYTNPIPIPSEGEHITVSGPYVLDKEHANWAEIHPVYSLTITSSL